MSKKILLAEDEVTLAMNEARTLEKHGFEVTVAYSGEKAVEKVDSDPCISLILMDIVFGDGIDGPEAARKILETHDLPIVFLSSHTEPEIVDRTKGITSYGYVVKNSGETLMLASVNQALELFEAKSEVSDLYEKAPCGYHSLDANGVFVRVNETELSWLGYSRGELIGKKKFTDLITTESVETFKKNFPVFKERGRLYDVEFDMVRKDGTILPVLLNATAVKDSAGNYVMSRSTIIDITGRRQAEKKLRSIEWMLSGKKLTRDDYIPEYDDVSPLNKDGLILHSVGKEQLKDIASEYLDLLETSTAIYERTGDYALGVFSSGWCRLMDSASRRLCGTEDNRKALESGRWLCHESCWKNASLAMNERRPVEIECNGGIRMYAVPITANGEIVGAVNFGFGAPPTGESELERLSERYKIPIPELKKQAEAYKPRPQFIIDYAKERIQKTATQVGYLIERKRTEEELAKQSKLLQEAQRLANLGSWQWDILHDRWSFSEQWKDIHGVTDDDLITQGFPGIVHPEDAPRVESAFREAREKKVPYDIEHRIIRPDNKERRYIHVRGEVEFDPATDVPIRMAGFTQDITERKELEELKEHINRVTWHDIRSPLNGIMGIPHILMEDENITDIQKEYLQMILDSGRRVLNLINLSLTIYQIEQGTYEYTEGHFDLLKIMRQCLTEYETFSKSKDIEIIISTDGFESKTPDTITVAGEELLAYSVVANLLKNAVEASPEGEHIKIEIIYDNNIFFSIHNRGAVPNTIRNTFFNKYTTSGKKGGTGIGTYSAKILSEAQGWSIGMQTFEEDGTKITVTIPV